MVWGKNTVMKRFQTKTKRKRKVIHTKDEIFCQLIEDIILGEFLQENTDELFPNIKV